MDPYLVSILEAEALLALSYSLRSSISSASLAALLYNWFKSGCSQSCAHILSTLEKRTLSALNHTNTRVYVALLKEEHWEWITTYGHIEYLESWVDW